MFDRPSRNNTVPDFLFKILKSTIFLEERLVGIRLSHEIELLLALHSDRFRTVLTNNFQRPSFIKVEVLLLSHDLTSQ